jgi:hypothetical protein
MREKSPDIPDIRGLLRKHQEYIDSVIKVLHSMPIYCKCFCIIYHIYNSIAVKIFKNMIGNITSAYPQMHVLR